LNPRGFNDWFFDYGWSFGNVKLRGLLLRLRLVEFHFNVVQLHGLHEVLVRIDREIVLSKNIFFVHTTGWERMLKEYGGGDSY
jgi:hypothetical protein